MPDERIIVIGQIDHHGRLAAVEKKAIRPKVNAIIAAGCFDTIVVVEDNDTDQVIRIPVPAFVLARQGEPAIVRSLCPGKTQRCHSSRSANFWKL